LLPGMAEIAEEIIGLPVRLGIPQGVHGLMDVVKSPIYATGVGLVLYGAKHQDQKHFKVKEDNIYTKVRRRMSAWIQDMI
jgi:cell division protein FtsA